MLGLKKVKNINTLQDVAHSQHPVSETELLWKHARKNAVMVGLDFGIRSMGKLHRGGQGHYITLGVKVLGQ